MKNRIVFLMFLFLMFFSCDLFNPKEPTTGTVTDYDGNVYQTVKIGDQWWMKENLNVTHFNNGDVIPKIIEDNWYEYNGRWDEENDRYLNNSAYCYYNDDSSNAETYGALYNAFAVRDSRGLAPEGWHIPSDEEWNELQIHLGMRPGQIDSLDYAGNNIGFKLKSTSGWDDFVDSDPEYGGNGTDEVGFCALPGGYRWNYGNSYDMGTDAYFWASTAHSDIRNWYRSVSHGAIGITRDQNFISFGFSVRCVKDEE